MAVAKKVQQAARTVKKAVKKAVKKVDKAVVEPVVKALHPDKKARASSSTSRSRPKTTAAKRTKK